MYSASEDSEKRRDRIKDEDLFTTILPRLKQISERNFTWGGVCRT